MKKQISKIIIAIFLVQTFASNFFYAAAQEKTCEDYPPVCTATSPSMQTYLEFQREMATLLSTNKFKTATEQVAEWKWWLFTSKILSLTGTESFADSLVWKTLRTADITATRSATSILTSLFLFELSAIWALADNTIGLTILLQDRPIVRDWSKLLDVERTLSEIAYELWSNWEIKNKITDVSAFDNIINKYKWEWLIEEATFWWSIAYTDLILQLAELNSAVKWFIAYDSTGMFDEYNNGDYNIKIQEKWIQELEDEYKCARRTFWFKCSTSWKSLTKNLKILTNNTSKQWKWAVKQIKDSYKELKQSLWNRSAIKDRFQWKDLTLTDRERELLESRYWLNAAKMTKWESSGLISLNSNIPDKWNSLAKWVKTAVKSFKWAITDFKEKWKNKDAEYTKLKEEAKAKKKELKDEVYVGNRNKVFFGINTDTWKKSEYIWTRLYDLMMRDIVALGESRTNSKAIVNASNNMDLTKNYVVLLAKIKELIDAIWDKEKWLRSSLNKFCSAQCANKWNECCYVK